MFRTDTRRFVHKAHPFVLPRYYFNAHLEVDPTSLQYLLPVMHYIGSLYAPRSSSVDLRVAAIAKLDRAALPSTTFHVQALLLLAIAMYSEDDLEQARTYLYRAICMALGLGMNTQDFAIIDVATDPCLAESWRRTWWSLYITDGLISTFSTRDGLGAFP